MSSLQIRQEINREVALLPAEKERQVLEFVRFLKAQEPLSGTPGETLRHLRGSISSEQLAEMTRAIEAECERVCVGEIRADKEDERPENDQKQKHESD